MSKSKIHHEASASQAEEPAGIASEVTGGWTPPEGETIDHAELGPWSITAEGLLYNGELKGDMVFAGAHGEDTGRFAGGLWARFTPKGRSENLQVNFTAAEVEGMSRQGLARAIARHGYRMAPGAESAVAGYMLAAWNHGFGTQHTIVTNVTDAKDGDAQ